MNTPRARWWMAPVLGAFATMAEAQYYWPAGHASSAGNAVMNAPFSARPGHPTATTRCMVVIDPSTLPFPVGTQLTRLSLRRDVRYPNQGYASASGTLVVRIGRAVAVPDQLQDVAFMRLWDGMPTIVCNTTPQVPFSIPGASAPGTSVPPFAIVIPFTQPYTWTGGPLAIDFVWTPLSGSSTFRVDAFATPRVNGTFRPAGAGCRASNGFIPFHYALPETTMPGAVLTVQMEGSRLPPSPGSMESFAIHLLGLQNTTYQGQSLPLALSASGGMPGCYLRVSPLLATTVAVSNPSALFARATSRVALPAQASLVGTVLYSQWLMLDGGYSAPMPLIASDAQAITLGQEPYGRQTPQVAGDPVLGWTLADPPA